MPDNGLTHIALLVSGLEPSGCASRAEVDRLCAQARRDGCLRRGPTDSPPPVCYWAFIADPDGHLLEVSFGQEVGLTVERDADAASRG